MAYVTVTTCHINNIAACVTSVSVLFSCFKWLILQKDLDYTEVTRDYSVFR